MRDRSGYLFVSVVAAALFGTAVGPAWPQSASPPPSLGAQAPVQQPAPDRPAVQQDERVPAAQPREENPGMFHEMGKLFEKSWSVLPSLKSPGEAIDDLNLRAKDAAKDVTDSLSRLAKPSSMVTGRMACLVASNGAPDCKAGADRLCQSRGFRQGKSLDTDAAEKCSAKVYLPGYKREPGDCRTENFVTRALCQ